LSKDKSKGLESDIFNIEGENSRLSDIAELLNSTYWVAYSQLLEENMSKISDNILNINSNGFLENKKTQESVYKNIVKFEIIKELLSLPERAKTRISQNNVEIGKLKSFLNKIKIKR